MIDLVKLLLVRSSDRRQMRAKKEAVREQLLSDGFSCYSVPSGLPHRSHCVPTNINHRGYGTFSFLFIPVIFHPNG